MSNLDELIETEKKTAGKNFHLRYWDELRFLYRLRNAVPTLLQIAACFREGDVSQLICVKSCCGGQCNRGIVEMADRLMKAAKLAEELQ